MKLEQASLSWLQHWPDWIQQEELNPAWDIHACRQVIEQRLRREIFRPLPAPPTPAEHPISPDIESYLATTADDLRSSFTTLSFADEHVLPTLNAAFTLSASGAVNLPACAHLLATDTMPSIAGQPGSIYSAYGARFHFGLSLRAWQVEHTNEALHDALAKTITQKKLETDTLRQIGYQSFCAALETADLGAQRQGMSAALQAYADCLARNPEDFISLFTIGQIAFFVFGRPEEAISAYQQAATASCVTAPFFSALSWLHVAYVSRCAKSPWDAARATGEAVRIWSRWPEILYQHAVSCARLEQSAEMQEALCQVIAYEPAYWFRALTDPDLLSAHEQLHQVLNEFLMQELARGEANRIPAENTLAAFEHIIDRVEALGLPAENSRQYLETGREAFTQAISLQMHNTYFEYEDAQRLLATIPDTCQQGRAALYQEGIRALNDLEATLRTTLHTHAEQFAQAQQDLEADFEVGTTAAGVSVPVKQSGKPAVQLPETDLNNSLTAPDVPMKLKVRAVITCFIGTMAVVFFAMKGEALFGAKANVVTGFVIFIAAFVIIFTIYQLFPTSQATPAGRRQASPSSPSAKPAVVADVPQPNEQFEMQRVALREMYEKQSVELVRRLDAEVEQKREALNALLRMRPVRVIQPTMDPLRATAPSSQCIDAHHGKVSALVTIPKRQLLASGGEDGLVQIWTTTNPHAAPTTLKHGAPIVAIAASPDGNLLATATRDGVLRVWKITSGTMIHRLERTACSVAFSTDGTTMASGNSKGLITTWKLPNFLHRFSLPGHLSDVNCLAFIPDATLLVSAGVDTAVRFWSMRDGELDKVLVGHRSPVIALAICPGGRTVVTAGTNGQVNCWPLFQPERMRTISHSTPVVTMVCHPTDHTIFLADINGKILCAPTSGAAQFTELLTIPEQSTVMAALPDGSALVTGDEHGILTFWPINLKQPTTEAE
ncbi:MAG: WD40 domain-containing protein [Armatimonadota bacterium]